MNAHSPTVAEYMTRGPYAVEPSEPLGEARRLMERHGIRHLPVATHGKLVGVLSDRDLELVWMLAHGPSDALTVEDAMTEQPYTIAPDTEVSEAAREMAKRKIGSAIVVEGPRVAGVFTSTDAMVALADLLDGDSTRRIGH
jgi:acetoin utilization protein AcuB